MRLDLRNRLIPGWKALPREEQKRVWLAASKLLWAERTTKPLFALIAMVPMLVLTATSNKRAADAAFVLTLFSVAWTLETRAAKHARAILLSPGHGGGN
jgi:hypothetical protein